MEEINIKEYSDKVKSEISEEEINNIYIYLSMFFDEMEIEEQKMWIDLMEIIDPE